MSTDELPMTLCGLPSEMVLYILQRVGHTKWLRHTLWTSKLLRKLSREVLQKRMAPMQAPPPPMGECRATWRIGEAAPFHFDGVVPSGPRDAQKRFQSVRHIFKTADGTSTALVYKCTSMAWTPDYQPQMHLHDVGSVQSESNDHKSPFDSTEPLHNFAFQGVYNALSFFGDSESKVDRMSFVLPKAGYAYFARSWPADEVDLLRYSIEPGKEPKVARQVSDFHTELVRLLSKDTTKTAVAPDGKSLVVVSTYENAFRYKVADNVFHTAKRECSGITLCEAAKDGELGMACAWDQDFQVVAFSCVADSNVGETHTKLLCTCRLWKEKFDEEYAGQTSATALHPNDAGLRLKDPDGHEYSVKILDWVRPALSTLVGRSYKPMPAAQLLDGRFIAFAQPAMKPKGIVVYRGDASNTTDPDPVLANYSWDYPAEAVFGFGWWQGTGMECTHIVPLDGTHVLFAISRPAEDGALSMTPVTDIYVVDISLQQRVQRIFAMGGDADVCSLRSMVPRGPLHDFKQFFVRPDGRVLALCRFEHCNNRRMPATHVQRVLYCIDAGILQLPS